MPRKQYTTEEVKQIISNWKASNKNVSQFARENGYSQASLGRWIKKFGKIEYQNKFVELPKLQVAKSLEKQTIVIEKADIKITVPLNVEQQNLQNIMSVLVACK